MNKYIKKYFYIWCIVAAFLLFFLSLYILPMIAEYKGKVMNPLGIYGEYKYATIDSVGSESGLYRSKKSVIKYEKLSKYYPKLKDEMRFIDNYLFYIDTSGSIVKYDIETGMIKRNPFGEHRLSLLAVSQKHFLAYEYESDQVYTFYTDSLEIENTIGKYIPINIELTDKYFDFTDKLTGNRFRYRFDSYDVLKLAD